MLQICQEATKKALIEHSPSAVVVGLTPEWQRAVDDVVASALSYRLRFIMTTRKNCYSEADVIANVHSAVGEARDGFGKAVSHEDFHKDCTCRHEAILAVSASYASKVSPYTYEEIMKGNVAKLKNYLYGRS